MQCFDLSVLLSTVDKCPFAVDHRNENVYFETFVGFAEILFVYRKQTVSRHGERKSIYLYLIK